MNCIEKWECMLGKEQSTVGKMSVPLISKEQITFGTLSKQSYHLVSMGSLINVVYCGKISSPLFHQECLPSTN